jgi:hypothetical protein
MWAYYAIAPDLKETGQAMRPWAEVARDERINPKDALAVASGETTQSERAALKATFFSVAWGATVAGVGVARCISQTMARTASSAASLLRVRHIRASGSNLVYFLGRQSEILFHLRSDSKYLGGKRPVRNRIMDESVHIRCGLGRIGSPAAISVDPPAISWLGHDR